MHGEVSRTTQSGGHDSETKQVKCLMPYLHLSLLMYCVRHKSGVSLAPECVTQDIEDEPTEVSCLMSLFLLLIWGIDIVAAVAPYLHP